MGGERRETVRRGEGEGFGGRGRGRGEGAGGGSGVSNTNNLWTTGVDQDLSGPLVISAPPKSPVLFSGA